MPFSFYLLLFSSENDDRSLIEMPLMFFLSIPLEAQQSHSGLLTGGVNRKDLAMIVAFLTKMTT
jgi:hypothetical protein